MKRAVIVACLLAACRTAQLPAPPPTPAPAEVTPLLTSGFESGVVAQAPRVESGDWVQYITGADEGFDWMRDLPKRGFPPNRMTYLVPSANQLSRYAETTIDTLPGRDGVSTRALYMALKKQATGTGTGTRVQFGIYPPIDMAQGYVSYWLKLQPNLATEILPQGKRVSRQVMELKETGTPNADFRWGVYIQREYQKDLYWRVQAQYGDLAASPQAWECVSSAAPVPVGEWFKLELYWKSGLTDGRVWGAVNGATFVDYVGRTRADSPVYVWWPFKVYTGSDLASFGGKPIYQWMDDVTFDDAPPINLPAAPSGEGYTCETP